MSSSSLCFPSDPDITGIGVRVAIYAQNLLSFAPAAFALLDKKVTQTELDTLETQSTTILITAFAILFSTIVQALTNGMTNLHAVVILNLSWMNNTNLFIYFLLYIYHRIGALEEHSTIPEETRGVVLGWVRRVYVYRGRRVHEARGPENILEVDLREERFSAVVKEIKVASRNLVFIFGSVHLTVMAAVGIWLWRKPAAFGDSHPCSQSVLVVILGSRVPLISKGLKQWSIFIYSLLLTPVLNLVIPTSLFSAPTIIRFLASTPNSSHRKHAFTPTICGLAVLAVVNIIFLVDTEVMLRVNSPLADKGDGNWTFGQTLALLLLLVPLRDVVETLVARRPKRLGKKLLEASAEGKLDVVQYVHDLGADPNVKGPSLVSAMKNSHLDIAKFLIGKGAQVDSRDERSSTALIFAAKSGCLDIVQLLLEAKADVNIQGYQGSTALILAVENGHLEIVRLLLQSQANVNIADSKNSTALIYAAKNGYLDIIKLLLEFKADANIKDPMGSTALMLAAMNGYLKIVELLLEYKGEINVNINDPQGWANLKRIANNGHLEIARLLLEYGEINIKDQWYSKNLMSAAENGYLPVVKLLLMLKDNVDTKGQLFSLAFMYAVKNGHSEVAKVFKEHLATGDLEYNYRQV